MRRGKGALPPLPASCSSADGDSRGPGWYCCECNSWNPDEEPKNSSGRWKKLTECRFCEHKDCRP